MFLGQQSFHFLFGPAELGFGGSLRNPHDLCNLLMVVSLEQIEGKHGAVAIGQFADRMLDPFHIHVRFAQWYGSILHGGVAGFECFKMDLIALEVIDAVIYHDPFDPGPDRILLAERVQMGKHIEEGTLKDIFGVLLVAQHAQANVVHRPRIEAVQFELCLPVAMLTSFYDILVRAGVVQVGGFT
jgi:hypothetical protein